MSTKYYISANRANFFFLKKEPDAKVVLALGTDPGKAIDAAREFVNMQRDGSTLDEGNAASTHHSMIVKLKQHDGKTLGYVLQNDPNFLIWFYENFDMGKNRRPENQQLWQALDEMAKDSHSAFSKAIAKKNRAPEARQHAGRVGEDLVICARVISSFTVKGKYKTDPLKIIMMDEHGNSIWLVSACKIAKLLHESATLSIKQQFKLTVTVLMHSDYKGVPQTKVKIKQLESIGRFKIGCLLHFDHSVNTPGQRIEEQLSKLSIFNHCLVDRVELKCVELGDVTSPSDTLKPQPSYVKGIAFYTVFVNAKLSQGEIRELFSSPLRFTLDGISLTKIEQSVIWD